MSASWSPRTRGWSRSSVGSRVVPKVVPAHAGVVPTSSRCARRPPRGPRARGGGPRCGGSVSFSTWWSPRTRGWSRRVTEDGQRRTVVPAHAGVVPWAWPACWCRRGGPRARGGGPLLRSRGFAARQWSPRTRGWSLRAVVRGRHVCVVPAHAGVVPAPSICSRRTACGPRARGGGPRHTTPSHVEERWSPRTRGWSLHFGSPPLLLVVVPAHAGVVPRGATPTRTSWRGPRARGGGPAHHRQRVRGRRWSPRTRGWSHAAEAAADAADVVPAHAGVVPRPARPGSGPEGGPRARGGGPGARFGSPREQQWSPRTRGWSDVQRVVAASVTELLRCGH